MGDPPPDSPGSGPASVSTDLCTVECERHILTPVVTGGHVLPGGGNTAMRSSAVDQFGTSVTTGHGQPLPANDPYPQVSADESEIAILSVDAAR